MAGDIIAINDSLVLMLDDGEQQLGHVEGKDGYCGPIHSVYAILARPGWELVEQPIVTAVRKALSQVFKQ